ncbi:hypothetical protein LSM04_006657 [Trypanosoma melophagium]|uniref:uncharacterized protein n=1 Tax=Trypanosoma melophagium TaxID=715481 RepID=UPI00351A5ABE|nr:hypothetical protein LSM04_000552 [Trypanosoma melophagium]KAH9600185.1 hypothetical protein LSM04_006657 [Trypanosoma melophagium]
MPTESKPSKRQRQRGRTAAIVFFEVELPKGEEIKEGDVDTAFEEATKRRRSRSLLSTTKEDDQAIDL